MLPKATNAHNKDRKLPKLGLFYFSSAAGSDCHGNKYKLLLDTAGMADEFGFSAIWTPERHFHKFGDLFPNPSVLSAALAVKTHRIAIRAGSVVLPLHDPIRVAEEWSIVDNLSGGRVGIAFAAGWQINDFVLKAENYRRRREVLFDSIAIVRKLWNGLTVLRTDLSEPGSPYEVEVKTYPRPIQKDLPIWIATGGKTDVFRKAGEIGASVLTHLIGQNFNQLRDNIQQYKASRDRVGLDPSLGNVTIMMHTLAGDKLHDLKPIIRPPLKEYLRSFNSLDSNLHLQSGGMPSARREKMEELRLAFGVEKYIDEFGLFGSVAECRERLEFVRQIGVDEIACLIDFGADPKAIFNTLQALSELNF